MAAKQRNKRPKQHQSNGNNTSSSAKEKNNGSENKSKNHAGASHSETSTSSSLSKLLLILAVIATGGFVYHLNTNSEASNVDDTIKDLHESQKLQSKYNVKYSLDSIDRRSNLSLEEYREVYDGKWPVLITDVLPSMKAMNWTKQYFIDNYGKDIITIRATDSGLEGVDKQDTLAMPMGLFLSHLHESKPNLWTYLMDELYLLQKPDLLEDINYNQMLYLEDDYFQLFPREIRPWNSMLLWGTKYSRSHLHIDPYNWTGTNAVFSGLKKWKLFPPGQDYYLHVKTSDSSGFPLNCQKYASNIDAFDPDLKKFPKFAKAKAIEFDQHPGELLMIPTGWFHQAYNDQETLAVSSQVMNVNNYKIVLEEIFKAKNLDKKSLPANFETLSPEEQVKTVMKHLPERILKLGREETADALRQIDGVRKKQPKKKKQSG